MRDYNLLVCISLFLIKSIIYKTIGIFNDNSNIVYNHNERYINKILNILKNILI
ncbi:hypothetical protein QQI_0425 [Clostridioides difficile Y401]|nr:hypothetical protein QAW_0427 [Clostridioides difficile CD17]EQF17574.1 hypothetical protein QEQ_0458 [Clostridioides difficile CD144]EQG03563.1 hypothetical protein QGY_0348 [Clostridioides difficile 840]EQG78045.1 hypothetical protein QKA_1468 [Clostridioides difficile DA00165]EQG88361.1 hypothetical protein QKE_0448 [Clostridioides difficile DA00174]EQI02687.1 hypothetical protein QO7_0441 [Clostridioides difficile F314]EQI87538.1 hypothetical protein QQI_0425 [Clostridioides difficile 